MRKGADSYGQPSAGHASRGVRNSRRRGSVWLVTGATPNLTPGAHPHHTVGALALETALAAPDRKAQGRHCALIVEHDSALAQALAQALHTRFGPAWSVRLTSDAQPLAPAPRQDAPSIVVLDASASADTDETSSLQFSALPDLRGALTIFVTADTSYQLSQRGISGGVVLRKWRSLDEIVSLVAEALAEE